MGVVVKHWSCKKQAVNYVQYTAHTRNKPAGILDFGCTLEHGLSEVSTGSGKTEQGSEGNGID